MKACDCGTCVANEEEMRDEKGEKPKWIVDMEEAERGRARYSYLQLAVLCVYRAL
jgi:hypothetical protein